MCCCDEQTLKRLEDELAAGPFFERLIEQQLLNAPRATIVMTPGTSVVSLLSLVLSVPACDCKHKNIVLSFFLSLCCTRADEQYVEKEAAAEQERVSAKESALTLQDRERIVREALELKQRQEETPCTLILDVLLALLVS